MKRKGERPPSPLLAIADFGVLGAGLARAVSEAQRGGVRWVLLRGKGLTLSRRAELAREIRRLAPGLVLSVHGGADGLMPGGADGVHFPSAMIEKCSETPTRLIAGASCHDGGELSRSLDSGADYVFLSPVFAPISKDARAAPLGVMGFAALIGKLTLPVYALGGMRPEAAKALADAGAGGVAVLGDMFLADDVCARARLWVNAVGDAFGKV